MSEKSSNWLNSPIIRIFSGVSRPKFGENLEVLRHPLSQNICLTVLVALFYVAGIKVSDQLVSTLVQGRITPIWFPSALTLGLFFHFGYKVIPGIILGSVFGLISVLSTFTPPLTIPQFLLLEIAFAGANTAQPLIADFWLKEQLKKTSSRLSCPLSFDKPQITDPLAVINPFKELPTTIIFIKSAIFAPMVSATIGIGALVFLSIVPLDNAIYSWVTWWLNSTLAIIIFSPILITAKFYRFSYSPSLNRKAFTLLLAGIAIGFLVFYKGYSVAYLFLPLILMVVYYFRGFIGSLTVAVIALCSIFATTKGYGVFVQTDPNNDLIFLQISS